ncbi:MAG: hypothetical protein EAZ21_13850, partial [Betaproteobacteria bacterium]
MTAACIASLLASAPALRIRLQHPGRRRLLTHTVNALGWLFGVLFVAISGGASAANPAHAVNAGAAPAQGARFPIQTGVWTHALSAYQAAKYPANFTHFDYVNPNAPKGGRMRLANPDRRTSFDKLNPFSIKGVAPAAMEMFVFERLGTFSMDEPKAMYGLLAEAMYVEPDMSAISFRIHPRARFSNGDPVTPADVVDSFNRLKGKLVLPTYASAVAGATSVVATDTKTVRITLKERTIDAIFAIGDVPIFSKKWGDGKPLSDIVLEQPIASGP